MPVIRCCNASMSSEWIDVTLCQLLDAVMHLCLAYRCRHTSVFFSPFLLNLLGLSHCGTMFFSSAGR